MTLQRRFRLVRRNAEDQWMETALKVAFATADMKHVDQHFGAAKSFAIYAVDRERTCFVEASEFGQLDMDGTRTSWQPRSRRWRDASLSTARRSAHPPSAS